MKKLGNKGFYELTILLVVLIGWVKLSIGSVVLPITNKLEALISTSQDQNKAEDVILDTPLGKVKGYILQSREGRDYFAFYKVPYAKPPVGILRFKSPEPTEKWGNVRDQKNVGQQCIQRAKDSDIIEGEEDCLYLNIYTPKLPKTDGPQDALLPTLLYIHGGDFLNGNGSKYGGKYFMDEDVVLITFQYRLGPLGFIKTEDGEITGNMGFKDQIMALYWVRDNVKYFGGDPNKVMIFGNSAGAASVSHMMLSPMANGLFHSAISESGGSFCQSRFDTDATKTTFTALASEVGCSSTNQSNVIQCLQEIDAHDLAFVRTKEIVYDLVIENYESDDSSNKFMPDTPFNMVKSGRVNKVPWIIGVNSGESVGASLGYLTDVDLIRTLNYNFTRVGSEILGIHGPETESILLKVKDFYFEDNRIGNETMRNLMKLLSDRAIIHCSKVQAIMQSEYSDVYLYYLSKEPETTSYKIKLEFPPGEYGTGHGEELHFLFNYNPHPEILINSSYFPFSKLLVKMWTQFALLEKPYSINGSEWKTVKSDQTPISWFELNEIPHPTTTLQSRMEFWDQFTTKVLNYE